MQIDRGWHRAAGLLRHGLAGVQTRGGKADRRGAGQTPGVEDRRRQIRRYDQRRRRPDERAAEEYLPRLLSGNALELSRQIPWARVPCKMAGLILRGRLRNRIKTAAAGRAAKEPLRRNTAPQPSHILARPVTNPSRL